MKLFKSTKGKILLPLIAAALLAGCSTEKPASAPVANPDVKVAAQTTEQKAEPAKETKQEGGMVSYTPPSLDAVPEGGLGDAIKYGYELHQKTNELLPENVGNKLSCSSCHGDAGRDDSSPLTGVTAVYPAPNPRAGAVLTIEDRINGCFQRSMNGKPLAYNSNEMRAMVAYLTYISKDVPVGIKERPWIEKNSLDIKKKNITPNAADGEKLYQTACLACHAADGSGNGATTGPALWGENSFNNGAGMGRISTAAGYIQRNMPKGAMGGIKEGELTDQQAADLADYILSKDRPVFKDHAKDWPKGKAPKDVPYFDELESTKKGLNK